MEEFRFLNPEYFYFTIGIVFLIAVYFFAGKSKLSKIELFSPYLQQNSLILGSKATSKNFVFGLIIASLLLFIVALARPQANPITEKRLNNGLDIMILLDTSTSMAAEDLKPSRLSKAKHLIRTLIKKASGDRLGLMAFAGTAVLVSPLTSDYEILDSFLETIDVTLLSSQGTNIAEAIEQAIRAFERGSPTELNAKGNNHVIFLLSDGEQTDGKAIAAADKLKKLGISLHAVAIGTKRGSPIPLRDDSGNLTGYKKDKNQEVVISKVDGAALEKIAKAAGGTFYFASVSEQEINSFLNAIKNLNRTSSREITTKIFQEYYQYPCFLALLLLIIAVYLNVGRNFRSIILLLSTFFSFNSNADSLLRNYIGDEEYKSSNQAIKKFEQKEFDEALSIFQNLQSNTPDSSELAFNTFTTLLAKGEIEEAQKMLENIRNTDIQYMARFNLANTLMKKSEKDKALQEYLNIINRIDNEKNPSKLEEKIRALAKKNLEAASQSQSGQSEERNQENQKDDKKNEEKNQNKKEDQNSSNEDKNNKEKENNNNNSNSDRQKNNDEKSSGKKSNEPFEESKDLSKKDASNILRALEGREKKLQKKFLQKKSKGVPTPTEKDW